MLGNRPYVTDLKLELERQLWTGFWQMVGAMLKMTESSNWGGKGAVRQESGEEARSKRKT